MTVRCGTVLFQLAESREREYQLAWLHRWRNHYRRLAATIVRPAPAPVFAHAVARAFEQVYRKMRDPNGPSTLRAAFDAYPARHAYITDRFAECAFDYERLQAQRDEKAEARYWTGGIRFRVGMPHPGLDDTLRRLGAGNGTFVCGADPGLWEYEPQENEEFWERLRGLLNRTGLRYFPAHTAPAEPDRPTEFGFFVLDASRRFVRMIGRKAKQHYVVRHELDCFTELVGCYRWARDDV